MYRLIGLCALLGMAGCASTPAASGGGDTELVCERYYPTGSNLPKTRCFTAEEKRQQDAGVDEFRDAINRANRPQGGAPGT
ncbi:MAG: hypothetical protein U5L03_05015 [Burkholderiaceae bacterium]|nr:hypothetical protein [Burkholderiaceae bacterium]